ncbi:hypothetical protein AB0872_22095 [Microbacterium sp. NPDC047426]
MKTSAQLLPFGTATIDAQPNGKRDHCSPSRPIDLRKEDVTQLLKSAAAVGPSPPADRIRRHQRLDPVPHRIGDH